MKTTVAAYLGLVTYITVWAIPIVLFDVDMWLAVTVLLGVPALCLYRLLRITLKHAVAIAAFAVTHAFVWQLIGHSTGAWYELSSLSFHLFGLVPLESLWYGFVVSAFIVFVYEYFIDDTYIDTFTWTRTRTFASLLLGVVMVVSLVYGWLVSVLYVPYAFALALGVLGLLWVGIFYRGLHGDGRVLEKLGVAILVLLPLLAMVEIIALTNTHVVFANETEYLLTLSVVGELVPIEKLVLVVFFPAWVLLLHEWLLDDRA